jgi:hypothetical protein
VEHGLEPPEWEPLDWRKPLALLAVVLAFVAFFAWATRGYVLPAAVVAGTIVYSVVKHHSLRKIAKRVLIVVALFAGLYAQSAYQVSQKAKQYNYCHPDYTPPVATCTGGPPSPSEEEGLQQEAEARE